MSERATAYAVTYSMVAGYVVARLAYGGPWHATPLDILIVLIAACLGAATTLVRSNR